MRTTLLAGTALTFTLLATPAFAQTAEPTAAADEADNGGLEEIVVTAQRKEESAQKAGIAISVVSPDAIIEQGITQATQLGQLVPSLQVQTGGGASSSLFIRGVGNFTVNGYSDPAVAVNYDGVYLGRPTSFSGLFYDLERLEVLKGPQGTLYGRNATGGAINILPAKPKLGELSGNLTAGYGNYNAFTAQGAINLPMGENGALRISGSVNERDGYLTDGTSDDVAQALRVQMAAELTPSLNVRIGADYSHTGGKGPGSSYLGFYSFTGGQYVFNPAPASLTPDIGLFDPRSQAYRQTLFVGTQRRTAPPLEDITFQDNEYFGVNAEVNWETSIGTFTVLPAWRRSDLDFRFAVPAFVGWTQEVDEQFSLEARLNGNRIGMFDYVIGAYYFDESVDGNYTFNNLNQSAYQDFTTSTKSFAGFARVTANITDELRVIGGVRYTMDDKAFNGVADVVLERCIGPNLPFVTAACAAAPLLPTTDRPDQLPFPFVVPSIPGVPTPLAGGALPGPALILARTTTNATQSNNQVT